MGYEESYGYLLAPFVRDKDALQACLILAEAAAHYQSQNKTLVDVLYEVFDKVGAYEEETVSLTLSGAEGAQRIQEILADFRNNPLTSLGGIDVVYYEDYLSLQRHEDNQVKELDFPEADVLKYGLQDNSWLAVRPSGTEPKCKFYYCVVGKDVKHAKEKLSQFKDEILERIA